MSALRYSEAVLAGESPGSGPVLRFGHVLWLDRFKSPFLQDMRKADLGDLLLALAICRHADPLAVRVWPWWLKLQARLWLLVRLPLPLAIVEFHEWLNGQCHCPEFWNTQAGRQPGTPWLLTLQHTMQRLGYRFDEVMRLPMARVLWECAAQWEHDGAIELANETELLLKRRARERRRPQNAATMAARN